MARLYADFIEGTLTADPGAAGTTLNAAILASLPVVASPDTLKLVLDPEQVAGAPEIVTVTTHTSAATSATIVRGADGTTGRAHAIGITVALAPVVSDIEDLRDHVETVYFSEVGTLAVKTGTFRWYAPFDLTIIDSWLSVGTAPTGTTLIFDVNKNGTTIYGTQSNRPTVAISGFFDVSGTPSVTAMSKDTDYLTVDIDQIGSTVAGSDAVLGVRFIRS